MYPCTTASRDGRREAQEVANGERTAAQHPGAGVQHIYAGPYAGMHLSDLGADVIKIEPPLGEAFRHTGSVVPGTSKAFRWLNRGKRSLVLNLAGKRAQEIVHRMVP